MGKPILNEETAVSRFIDAFFTGLQTNSVNRVLNKAKKARVSNEAISKMKEIERSTAELKDILSKIPVPKKF